MDIFPILFAEISYYLGYLGELFFLISLFLIHKKFKMIETYIMFYTLLTMDIFQYLMEYMMQKPEVIYSENGVIASMTQPSSLFEYSLYLLPYFYIIVYSALLVFSIKLYKK